MIPITGATQSSPLDATSITSGWGGNPTASVTTLTANDLVTSTLGAVQSLRRPAIIPLKSFVLQ
jgi:hypothetical protein